MGLIDREESCQLTVTILSVLVSHEVVPEWASLNSLRTIDKEWEDCLHVVMLLVELVLRQPDSSDAPLSVFIPVVQLTRQCIALGIPLRREHLLIVLGQIRVDLLLKVLLHDLLYVVHLTK